MTLSLYLMVKRHAFNSTVLGKKVNFSQDGFAKDWQYMPLLFIFGVKTYKRGYRFSIIISLKINKVYNLKVKGEDFLKSEFTFQCTFLIYCQFSGNIRGEMKAITSST